MPQDGDERGRSWRLVAVSDGATLGYDANGNVVTRTVGGVEWRYVYDPENCLQEVWRGAERVAAFGYDAGGNWTVWEVGGLRRVVVDEGYEVRGGVGCGLGGGPLWDLLFGGSLAWSLWPVLGMGVLLGDPAV